MVGKKHATIKMFDITSISEDKYEPQKNPRFWNYDYYLRCIDDDNFMRVFAPQSEDGYHVLEYKEGEDLFRVYNLNTTEINSLFELYLLQDPSWKNTVEWQEVDESDQVFQTGNDNGDTLVFNNANIDDEEDDGVFITLGGDDVFVPRHRLNDLILYLRAIANDIEEKIDDT